MAVRSDGTLGVFDSKVLSVEGALIVLGSLGTEVESEVPKAGDWAGIQIMSTSPNSRLTSCRIQHATIAITCQANSVHVERCLIVEYEVGILCDDTSPFITQNELNKNGTAIQCDQTSESEISYNTIQSYPCENILFNENNYFN